MVHHIESAIIGSSTGYRWGWYTLDNGIYTTDIHQRKGAKSQVIDRDNLEDQMKNLQAESGVYTLIQCIYLTGIQVEGRLEAPIFEQQMCNENGLGMPNWCFFLD